MTTRYGYLGSIDAATLSADGEPTYTPACENRWAKELMANDGKWRFLKNGQAFGHGAGNVFDATLADNFTVIALVRGVKPNNNDHVSKSGATDGFRMRTGPQSVASINGLHLVLLESSANNYYYSTVKTGGDLQWHWHGITVSGASLNMYSDALKKSFTRPATSLLNTNNLYLHTNLGSTYIAATLIFNRVLTDTEVSNIMLGKTMPGEVSGLVGYYKFNETHGTAAGQCTDYSGQGNHLTYSGAVWETWGPNILTNGDFSDGLTGWTVTVTAPATVTASDGGARLYSGAGAEYASITQQAGKFVKGNRYRLTLTVKNWVSGQATITDNSTNSFSTSAANGTYSWTFIASTNLGVEIKRANANTDLVIDNVILEDLSGQSGQPYVTRTKRNESNWWERMPPAIADPERMGCVAHNAAVSTSAVNYALTTNWSIDVAIKMFAAAHDGIQYASNAGLSVTTNGTKLSILNSTGSYTITLSRPIPMNKWTRISVSVSAGTATGFVNGVSVGTVAVGTNSATSQAIHIGQQTVGRKGLARSARLFSRAITASEVNELFLTDTISDRSDLVGEWLMNEPWRTGTNNIQDTSGNGLHTTTTNPLLLDSPYTVMRRKRKGKQLNSKTNVGAYFTNFAGIKAVLQAATIWTSSVWVKVLNDRLAVRLPWFSGQTSRDGLELLILGNKLQAYVSSSSSTQFPSDVNHGVPSGSWMLVSAEINWTTKQVTRYVNGKMIGQVTVSGLSGAVPAFSGDSLMNVFRQGGAYPATYDAVRIYNRALTADEHYALYLDQAPRDGLVAEYLFEQADIDQSKCVDTSGNGFHATWSGISSTNYVSEL